MWMLAVLALWLLIFLGLVPVVTGTSGSTESEGKMTKDVKKEVTTRVRSVATHRRWLNQYASDYTIKVNLYKTQKTREASEEAFQFREKIMDQQEKIWTCYSSYENSMKMRQQHTKSKKAKW